MSNFENAIEFAKTNAGLITGLVGAFTALTTTVFGGLFAFFHFLVKTWIDDRVRNHTSLTSHQNSKEIEEFKGEINAKIEGLRNTLSISHEASRIIIQKRLSCYESLFLLIIDVRDQFSGLSSVIGRQHPIEYKQNAQAEFFQKTREWSRLVASSQAFIPEPAFNTIDKLVNDMSRICLNAINNNLTLSIEDVADYHQNVYEFETLVEEDIYSIIESGSISRSSR